MSKLQWDRTNSAHRALYVPAMPKTMGHTWPLPSTWGHWVVTAGSAHTCLLLVLSGANHEIRFCLPPRMIQEEKESTELRAEEIETRVTSGSMEALNLTQLRKRGSIPTSLTALSLASASPPFSGRSTPKLTSRSATQDLDRMGVMTLVRVLGQLMNNLVITGLGRGELRRHSRAHSLIWAPASSSHDVCRPWHTRSPACPSGSGKGYVVSSLPSPLGNA